MDIIGCLEKVEPGQWFAFLCKRLDEHALAYVDQCSSGCRLVLCVPVRCSSKYVDSIQDMRTSAVGRVLWCSLAASVVSRCCRFPYSGEDSDALPSVR